MSEAVRDDPTYARLRARVPLDPSILDRELQETPMLLLEAAEQAAEAARVRDGSKRALSRVTSEEAERVRAEEKLSDVRAAQLAAASDAVQAAGAAHDAAQHRVALWGAMVTALTEKASLMRRFAELCAVGYLTPNAVYSNTERTDEARAAMHQARIRLRGARAAQE